MKQSKNSLLHVLTIGFALFSMFFGAGNVIFPPYLGLQSGRQWFAGFGAYYIADVALALSDPSGLAVYEIDTAGRRRREIPSAVENGRLSFAVSTSGPDGGRLHYEVAVRQGEGKVEGK